jgi:hypothetical protein
VDESGRAALLKGYTTGKLSREDVEAIRLYRISQGQEVVGEAFLPFHLGLHPRTPEKREEAVLNGKVKLAQNGRFEMGSSSVGFLPSIR